MDCQAITINRRSRLKCFAVWLLGWPLLTAPAIQQSASDGMPFELAFSQRNVGPYDRVTLAPDGQSVAYVIHTPDPRGRIQPRWLPSGAPANVGGKTLRVTYVSTSKTQSIGPSESNCWRPSFSPDSTRVAFYCDASGAVHLWVHDLSLGTSRQIGDARIKAKLWVGDEPVWNPTGTEIFVPLVPEPTRAQTSNVISKLSPQEPRVTVERAGGELASEGQVPSQPVSRGMVENSASLAAIDIATGTARTVVPSAATPSPSLLKLSPTGRWLAYLSVSGLELGVAPASSGAVRLVATGLHNNRSAGFDLTAWAWHPTRDQLFWIQDHRLWTLDAGTVNASPSPVASQLTDITIGPMAFARDGQYLVVGVDPLDVDDFHNPYPRAIAVVPLNGSAPHVFRLPSGLYAQSLALQQGTTIWQQDRAAITIICQEARTAERAVVRLDLRSSRVITLWKGFANLQIVGASTDYGVLIGTFEDVGTPGNLYRFSADFAQKVRITDIEPRLAGHRIGPLETFQTAVPLYDGTLALATAAVLLPPGRKPGERLPTLVVQYPGLSLSHGRAAEFGGGDSALSLPFALLTTRGYAVLLVDSPIGPMDTPGNPAAEMTGVVVPQVYRAVELGYTDALRVAVLGHSAGAYSAVALISSTNIFRAAVAIDGFYDLAGLYMPESIVHRRLGPHPWGDLQRYISNSPYNRADQIRTPLLLIHGESDTTCPVTEARKMFTALKTLNRPVQLATYQGEGHVVSDWSFVNAVDAGRRLVEFLDKHLRAVGDQNRPSNPSTQAQLLRQELGDGRPLDRGRR
jgi:dipeptidyl aminopeptidase/acylaminoacyl peptidase